MEKAEARPEEAACSEAVKKSTGQTAAPGRAIAFSGIWRRALKSVPDFFTASELDFIQIKRREDEMI
jgi:hypothetical protein